MTNLQKRLYQLQDCTYGDFQSRLIPTLPREKIIGVRMPVLRKLAKELAETEIQSFLKTLPHEYYEENMLHAILLSESKNYEECIAQLNRFLPFVDNWAVCDALNPKIFKEHLEDLYPHIQKWMASSHLYTSRFGIEMLMIYYLDNAFQPNYLVYPSTIQTEEYYLKMMIAWFYATALAKQWEVTIPYLENGRLEPWTHRKTIQKAVESYRITEEEKIYLKSLR